MSITLNNTFPVFKSTFKFYILLGYNKIAIQEHQIEWFKKFNLQSSFRSHQYGKNILRRGADVIVQVWYYWGSTQTVS